MFGNKTECKDEFCRFMVFYVRFYSSHDIMILLEKDGKNDFI